MNDKMEHTCGATTSKCHDFGQIPYSALVLLAKRFEFGGLKHGRDNWKKGLGNLKYALERINHIINHCYYLSSQLDSGIDLSEDTIEDNIGAILWGGAFLAEYFDDIVQNYGEDQLDQAEQVAEAGQTRDAQNYTTYVQSGEDI